MYKLSKETTREGVSRHVPAWRVACSEEKASLYLTPEWVLSLWESHANWSGVEFTFCYRSGRLAAVLPLTRSLVWKAGVPFAKVGLLTNGYGQNHNELIAFGPAREAVELLVSMLKETRWDVFEVTSVPVDSPSVMALQTAAAEAGVTVHTEVGVASPFISLERSWESFLLGRSSNFRSDMRRKWNKCTEAGLVLEEVTSVSEVDAALAEILQIEELSWKQQAGTSISVQELAIRFYRSFIPKAASEGWLRIFLARLEGRAIAYDMGVQLHGKYYMLKTGYDDRYGALSPGTFVRQHVMKCLFAEGAIEHDFLGDADAYKLRWTSSQRMHLHLYLWNATRWRSRAYLLAKRLHAARAIGQKSLKVLA